jgi:hypothetical protein
MVKKPSHDTVPLTRKSLISWRKREQEGMTKEQAMTVLGLTKTDGRKRPKTLADYTEDDLLEAFRAECQVAVGNTSITKNKLKMNVLTLTVQISFLQKVCTL